MPPRILFILSTYPHFWWQLHIVYLLFVYPETYFLFTFLVFFVKSEKCVPTNLSAIHKSKFSGQHFFLYLLFVYPETYFLFTP
jgi:hypothetical protein